MLGCIMARTAMTMSSGGRISEHLSVGILARSYPRDRIRKILQRLNANSQRVRDLPAEVLVYYVISLGLFMAVSTGEVLRCLVEGLSWLGGLRQNINIAGKSAISQARTRLGSAPLKALWTESVGVIAKPEQPGCFYKGMRLVCMDGSTLDVPDTAENFEHFGHQRASRGQAAFPQLRFVSLCESGTHAMFAVQMGAYKVSEATLAAEVLPLLQSDMLCIADRFYSTFPLWQRSLQTGASLLWRARSNATLAADAVLADGSYLSTLYPTLKDKRRRQNGTVVRVIEYELRGVEHSEPVYRLITNLLDPVQWPAQELAALYAQRWEIETALDEFKTHMRGGRVVLRSKTPVLVEQEFYGMMLAHWAVRSLMNEAAQKEHIDPDRLSFTHSIRVIRRKLASLPALSPSSPARVDARSH